MADRWFSELACAFVHLEDAQAGDEDSRAAGLTCVKKARRALRSNRQMSRAVKANAKARIDLIESKLRWEAAKASNGSNGRRQVGLGLGLKTRPGKGAKVATKKKGNGKRNGTKKPIQQWHFKSKAEAEAEIARLARAPRPWRATLSGSRGDWTVRGWGPKSDKPPPPKSRKIGGLSYTLQERHATKRAADAAAKKLRGVWPGWKVRTVGAESEWGVYVRKGLDIKSHPITQIPGTKVFDGVTFKLHAKNLSQKRNAEAVAKRLRTVGRKARITGGRGAWNVYEGPPSRNGNGNGKAKAKAKAKGTRAGMSDAYLTTHIAAWVMDKGGGRFSLYKALHGSGYVLILPSNNRTLWPTAKAAKDHHRGKWIKPKTYAEAARPSWPFKVGAWVVPTYPSSPLFGQPVKVLRMKKGKKAGAYDVTVSVPGGRKGVSDTALFSSLALARTTKRPKAAAKAKAAKRTTAARPKTKKRRTRADYLPKKAPAGISLAELRRRIGEGWSGSLSGSGAYLVDTYPARNAPLISTKTEAGARRVAIRESGNYAYPVKVKKGAKVIATYQNRQEQGTKAKAAKRPKAAAKAKAAKRTRAEELTPKGRILWVGWANTGAKLNARRPKHGTGWIVEAGGGKRPLRYRFATLEKAKANWKGSSWHRAGSKAARTAPKPRTTAKSQIKVRGYDRKPGVPGYSRIRGRLPGRWEDGKWKPDPPGRSK